MRNISMHVRVPWALAIVVGCGGDPLPGEGKPEAGAAAPRAPLVTSSTPAQPAQPSAPPAVSPRVEEAPAASALDTYGEAISTPPGEPPPASERPLPSDAATLTVSITFDDTLAPQLEAAAILEAHGLRGTFYVNSPRLHEASAAAGESQYMSIADALGLEERGHEVGGHSLSHPQLTSLPEAERVREILADRAELARLGLSPRSFAYPLGAVEADDPALGRSVLEVTASSGYHGARDTNGFSLQGCSAGPETIPPADAFRVRSVRSVNDAPPVAEGEPPLPPDTAATLLGWMDHAARCAPAAGASAWLPLIFHHLRGDCSAEDAPGSFCFELSELERLAAALASGRRCPEDAAQPCYRVAVAPVSAVLGSTAPAPALPALALRNPSLERTLASGNTECLQRAQAAGGTAVFTRSEGLAVDGLASERVEASADGSVSAELRITRDFGACSPYATPGQSYSLSLFYRAEPGSEPVLRFVTYRLTSDYAWELWQSAPVADVVAGEWVQHAFVTEAVAPGTLAFSFGLRLESAGAVNVDALDARLAEPPPSP